MERKDYLHNPTHIFMDDTPYFITAAIYNKKALLQDAKLKKLLLSCIQESFARYQWELHHWVILDDHYHLLAKSQNGQDLTKIIREIHSVSGFYIKQATQVEQAIWWNYWDYCPRNENDYFTHLNYLFNNPVKHHYVEDLADYPFSSFHLYLEEQGREILLRQFKEHAGYKDLYANEDDF